MFGDFFRGFAHLPNLPHVCVVMKEACFSAPHLPVPEDGKEVNTRPNLPPGYLLVCVFVCARVMRGSAGPSPSDFPSHFLLCVFFSQLKFVPDVFYSHHMRLLFF